MRRKYVSVTVSQRRLPLTEIDEHYSYSKYNRICHTNNTIKKPYFCPKTRNKCKMCGVHKRTFRYKNKSLKKTVRKDLNNYKKYGF